MLLLAQRLTHRPDRILQFQSRPSCRHVPFLPVEPIMILPLELEIVAEPVLAVTPLPPWGLLRRAVEAVAVLLVVVPDAPAPRHVEGVAVCVVAAPPQREGAGKVRVVVGHVVYVGMIGPVVVAGAAVAHGAVENVTAGIGGGEQEEEEEKQERDDDNAWTGHGEGRLFSKDKTEDSGNQKGSQITKSRESLSFLSK